MTSIHTHMLHSILYKFYLINDPKNVTVCSGTKANISCGYTGVYVPFRIMPNWRIIKRNIIVVLSVMKLFLEWIYVIINLMI